MYGDECLCFLSSSCIPIRVCIFLEIFRYSPREHTSSLNRICHTEVRDESDNKKKGYKEKFVHVLDNLFLHENICNGDEENADPDDGCCYENVIEVSTLDIHSKKTGHKCKGKHES